MKFGRDFFPILNFVIKLIRLIFEVFGDDDDKTVVEESKAKSSNGNDDAC